MRAPAACIVVLLLSGAFLLPCTLLAQCVENGTVVCDAPDFQYEVRIASDGAGGGIIFWKDLRNGLDYDIYAQYIDAYCTPIWTPDGVAVCTAAGDQEYTQAIHDGYGGAIAVWCDKRSTAEYDIYAQRIDASGNMLWTADGVAVCTAVDHQVDPELSPDGAGGAIITWRDDRNGSTHRTIYAQRIDASGSARWAANGAAVCTATGSRYSPQITPDGAGGALISWQDARSGSENIYVQRIDSLGSALWTADGVAICMAAGNQKSAVIATDGSGGAIVAWQDYRSGSHYDVYSRRIDAGGTPLWTVDGVAVCTAAGDQYEVGIISDGSDGAIISWRDDRNGGSNPDIYAQRVDPLGNALWTAGGAAVCTEPHTQCSPRITTDGFGGAVITWMDDRDETWNVYAQRIDAGGVLQWGTNGNPVSTAASDQQNPAIISHTDGSSIIAWEDFRSGFDFDIYAIRFGDEGVGTLLQSHSATLDGTDVSITWILEDIDPGARFHVLRARGPEWVFHPLDQAALVRDGLTYRFTDTACEAGTTCRYRVDVCDGQGRWTLFETGSIAIPTAPAALYQNRPNPFNPVTSIGYYLPGRCHVTLDIFDPSGRLVVRLVERTEGAGRHEIEWNGLDRNGNTAASGLYLYRLTAGKERISRKMILLR